MAVGIKELIAQLNRFGYRFKSFSLENEGEYTTDDADWNYKDVPHLQHVHHQVDAVSAVINAKTGASINLQRIFGIRMPMVVVAYEGSETESNYFTSLACFILIVGSSFEQVTTTRCKVTTTYHFGAPRWLLFLFPLVRFILRRNYEDLMQGDVPMRTRRGQLRSWGYRFAKPDKTYSFDLTTEISRVNVIPPEDASPDWISPELQVDVELSASESEAEITLGKSDQYGLRVVATPDQVTGFPRLCHHEGACLDQAALAHERLVCPWHGKRIAPIFKIARGSGEIAKFSLGNRTFTCQSNALGQLCFREN